MMVCDSPGTLSVIDKPSTMGSYEVRRKGGRNLIEHPPQFSPDETLLFVISRQSVQIYNVATAEFSTSLRNDENSSPIVGMGFPTDDDRSLITCNSEGSVINWKWHAGVQISRKDLQIPENSVVQSFHLINNTEAFISWYNSNLIYVGVVCLSTGNILRQPNLGKLKVKSRLCIAIENYDGVIAVALSNGSNKLWILDAAKPDKLLKRKITVNLSIISMAWNPSYNILAVGDSLGRVILWREPFKYYVTPKEICHWHHLPLSALTFSPRGGLMLTGGAERVAVAWGDNSKRFLPRLPAAIHHISTSFSNVAIATADNGIQIVDSGTFRVIGCIREAGGLGGVQEIRSQGPSLQYIRSIAGLLLPAVSGHLHLFSTTSNTLLYTMDVTNTNIIHPERENLNPEQIEINEICVGCCGQWLVTWEGKVEQERIRWWEWSGHDWQLHTVVACPHQPASFSSLCLAGDTPVTVTGDTMSNLRFWRLVDSVSGYEGKSVWYTNAKCSVSEAEPGGVALSSDGSVAAAWFGARLTFWDTNEGIQKASLSHPALRPKGKLVQFGRDSHMHFVACTTDTCLAVWNVNTLKLVWMVKLNTACLVIDPFSDRVAAVTRSNDVIIFKMNNPEPLMLLKKVLPPEQGKITSATFAPSVLGTSDFQLYFLREQQEIFVVERSDSGIDILPPLESINKPAKSIPSAYSALVAEKQTNLVSKQQSLYQALPSTKTAINELLLSAAAHAQPKLSSLCSTVLRASISAQKLKSTPAIEPEVKSTKGNDSKSTRNNNKYMKITSKKKLMKESLDWVINLINS